MLRERRCETRASLRLQPKESAPVMILRGRGVEAAAANSAIWAGGAAIGSGSDE